LFFDICVDWDALLLCDLCTAVTFDGLVHLEMAITEIMKLWLIQDGATATELASFLLQYQFASSSHVVASPCFSILPETCISPNFIRRPHLSVFMNFKLSSGCSTAETEGPGFETGQIALLATALRGSRSGCLTPGRLYLSRSQFSLAIFPPGGGGASVHTGGRGGLNRNQEEDDESPPTQRGGKDYPLTQGGANEPPPVDQRSEEFCELLVSILLPPYSFFDITDKIQSR